MSALSVNPPFPIFFDIDGQPLDAGYIYLGVANQDPEANPISAYWDAALTVAATQPIRTRGGFPVNAGVPARVYVNSDFSIAVKNRNGFQVFTSPTCTDRFNDAVVQVDSSDVTFLQAGTGAVTRTAQAKLRETLSVFDFMSSAQIAAVEAYTFGVDVTTACQAALDAARASNKDCYFPAGGYLVTSLTIPGNVSGGVDDRDSAIRIYGQGFGEPFVQTNTGGTVIKSVTDAPVIKDILGTSPSSNGTVEIDHIRFDGTSTTPVVLLESFYGLSSMHNCAIYQRGTGDGVSITYSAGVWVYMCWALNKDWASYTLGASRVGTGFKFANTYDSGLVTFSKCSSRGWLNAYSLGGGAGAVYSATIEKSECSVVYNGIVLDSKADKALISDNYFEGGDGGVGIDVGGADYVVVSNNLIFSGFATGIKDTSTSNKGTLIQGNAVAIGAVANGIGIDVTSSAALGGYNKNVVNNSIVYTAGTNGVNGIKISGTDPRMCVLGNMFDPRGSWTGTSTLKINDTSSNGVYGVIQKQVGDLELPVLSRGAVAFQEAQSALTQANVSGNILTIPDAGSYFACNASSAATVQRIESGVTSGRVIVFRTDTANMTFQDTAYIQLAGGASFSGPGVLTLMVDRIGGANYAYEISRTVF